MAGTAEKDFYKEWLGIPEKFRPPSPCQILGLPESETDPETIENAARGRLRIIARHENGRDAEAALWLRREIVAARDALLGVGPAAAATAPPTAEEMATWGPAEVIPESALPTRGELLSGEVEFFREMVKIAVFRGNIGREQAPMLEAQAERFQVSPSIAKLVIGRAFREREKARAFRQWLGIGAVLLLLVVPFLLILAHREIAANRSLKKAATVAQRGEYDNAEHEGRAGITSFSDGRYVFECTGRGCMTAHPGNFGDCVVSLKARCLHEAPGGSWAYGFQVRRPIGDKCYNWKGYRMRISDAGIDIHLLAPNGMTVTVAERLGKQHIRGKGEENVLEALCQGRDIEFYINGSFVYKVMVKDPKFLRGGISTFVQGKGTKVAFDDLAVYGLKP